MGEDMLALVTHMYTMMWEVGMTPAMLSNAITALLHKKGPTDDIRNYRPITLLNALHKIWERILEQRLRQLVSTEHAQMGSKAKNSAAVATMTKRSLFRLAKRMKLDIHSLQLDLSKAYNRVDRNMLWNKLIDMGVKGKLWSAIISTYAEAMDQIRIGRVRVPGRVAKGDRDPLKLTRFEHRPILGWGTTTQTKGVPSGWPCLYRGTTSYRQSVPTTVPPSEDEKGETH